MDETTTTLLRDTEAAEAAAAEATQLKHDLVELDRKRNKTREALRALQNTEDRKAWVCLGGMFVQLSRDKAKHVLQKDLSGLEGEVEETRAQLKAAVQRVQEAEGGQAMRGLGLQPLGKQDLGVIKGRT